VDQTGGDGTVNIMVVDERKELLREPYVLRLGGWTRYPPHTPPHTAHRRSRPTRFYIFSEQFIPPFTPRISPIRARTR
jgi:hypothetical protein